MFGSNSSGLITLASLSDAEHSFSPFSKDAALISPSMAEWILLNFDWPYRKSAEPLISFCEESQPDIQATIASRRLAPEWAEVDDRMLRLMKHLISRGVSIEERYCGYTPLLSAVLYGDAAVVSLLLAHGADSSATVDNPGRKNHGMSALELAKFLEKRDPEWMRDTLTALEEMHSAT